MLIQYTKHIPFVMFMNAFTPYPFSFYPIEFDDVLQDFHDCGFVSISIMLKRYINIFTITYFQILSFTIAARKTKQLIMIAKKAITYISNILFFMLSHRPLKVDKYISMAI